MTPEITVVVPTFERCAKLRRLLVALEGQSLPRGSFEVVVVDDGSSDDTMAMLQSQSFARWESKPNGGPASARNVGIRSAGAAIVAFTDDDCVPEPAWLASMLEAFADPAVVGVGGRIVPFVDGGFMTTLVTADRVVQHGMLDESGGLRYLATANAAYRSAPLRSVGGFDESFPAPAGEDVDLSVRMRAHGRLVFAEGAVVAHDHRLSVRDLLRTTYRHGQAREVLSRKHAEMSASGGARSALAGDRWKASYRSYRAAGFGPISVALGFGLRIAELGVFGIGLTERRMRTLLERRGMTAGPGEED